MSIHNGSGPTADRSQGASLGGSVNIEDAADVVMRDHFHLVRSLDGSDIRENFRARGSCRIERSVLKVFQGLNRILRSLSDQVVAHAVLPIQKEHRRDLEAAAE